MLVSADDVRALLGANRFRTSNELALQDGIALVLCRESVSFEREVALTNADRIDFMIGSLGIEVKIDGALSEVTRQLHRYAQSERVTELMLVTTRMKHRHMPATLNDKPLHVVHLLGSAL